MATRRMVLEMSQALYETLENAILPVRVDLAVAEFVDPELASRIVVGEDLVLLGSITLVIPP